MINLYFQKTQTKLLRLSNAVLFLAVLLFAYKAKAQCPQGQVNLNTQAQVNQFLVNFPNCTELTGNLYIGGNQTSDITDLSPLNNLIRVGGWIAIYHTSLTHINGLGGLTSVGADIDFRNNSLLTNIDGFGSLTTIGGLDVRNHSVLTSIDGFNNLTDIGTIGVNIQINQALQSINGFNSLTQIEGKFELRQNPNLVSFGGFNNLTTFGTYLYFNDTKVVNVTGLSSLTTVGTFMVIEGNTELTNIDFVNALTTVGANFAIRNNSQLQNLNGLSNLVSVGGRVQILNNTVLNNISGLQNINPTTISEQGLIIKDNPALSVCNLPNFCTYLANDASTHPRDISGNLGNCLDEAAVVTACSGPACPPGDVRLWTQADVNQFVANYPNCTEIEGLLRIGEDDGFSSDITDISGLSNLIKIGTILFIQNNGVLQNLDGLQGLTQLGDRLFIGINAQLQNIDGLNNISSIGGEIRVRDNATLNNIQGLQNIESTKIVGLYIYNNPTLAVCNLPNFCTYLANPADTHPRNISENAGDCVTEQAVIEACEGPACPPGSQISFTTQAQVNQFLVDYPNCTEILGNLFIGLNDATSDITDLSPLRNITHVDGWIAIYNTSLVTLNGLHNVATVKYDIDIRANANLTDISALEKASFNPFDGFGLTIGNNTALSVCHLDNFCAYLINDASTHPRAILNNFGDCANEQAVVEACLVSIDEFDTASFSMFPNPVTDVLNITYSKSISSVEVIDLMGRTVIYSPVQSTDVKINMSTLTAGMYLVRVNVDDQFKVVKVMKQ